MKYRYAIIHLQSKEERRKSMTMQEENMKKQELLKEIIANAIDLPPACLEKILEQTKGMNFTHMIYKRKEAEKIIQKGA